MRIFTAILFSLFISVNCYGESRPLTFGGASFPPFFGKEMLNEGPLIEIVREAFKVSNRKVIIKWLPWKRVLRDAEIGAVDGITFAWHSADREKFLHFGEAILPNENGLYYSMNNKSISEDKPFTYDELKGKKIGFVRGYAIPDKLKNSGAIFREGNNDKSLFKMLGATRVDYMYTDKHVGRHIMSTLKKNNYDHVKWRATLESNPNYLAISKAVKNADANLIQKQYSDGLKTIKANGIYEKILRKHHLIL